MPVLSEDSDELGFVGCKVRGASEGFHELYEYIPNGTLEFVRPILFQDGMDWDECELYYTIRSAASLEFRSALHMRRSSQRRASKLTLQQQHQGDLPSSLRQRSSAKRSKPHQTLRRSVSFDSLPLLNTGYSFCYGIACTELRKEPRVTFDDIVKVVQVPRASDYPEDVRAALWLTPEEMYLCNKGAARKQQMQKRETSKLQEFKDNPSLWDLVSRQPAAIKDMMRLREIGNTNGSDKEQHGITNLSKQATFGQTTGSLQMEAAVHLALVNQ